MAARKSRDGNRMREIRTPFGRMAAVAFAAIGWAASAAYVTDGLVLHYDAIDNAGAGVHDSSATSWKELTGRGLDFDLPSGAAWGDDCISFPRVGQTRSVLGSDFTDMTQQDFTFEFVVRLDPSEDFSAFPNDVSVIEMRRCSLWFRRPGAKQNDGYGAVGSSSYAGSKAMYWSEFSNFHKTCLYETF